MTETFIKTFEASDAKELFYIVQEWLNFMQDDAPPLEIIHATQNEMTMHGEHRITYVLIYR